MSDQAFYVRAERALRGLFTKAQAHHELHFVMALVPEFRGVQDAGWNTAHEAIRAYDEFTTIVKTLDKTDPIRVRMLLAFYAHVSEGSGFYEIPKAMMLTIEGRGNNILPFQNLVERHRRTGLVMAPNANRVMADLIGHAAELGFAELAETFRDAFDPDVRNAIAHADYILWSDGMRLRRRNGGAPRVIAWGEELNSLIWRGLNLFDLIRQIANEFVRSYAPPKTIKSRMSDEDPLTDYTIYFKPETGAFGFVTGGPARVQ